MNSMVGVRMNATGLQSPTPSVRTATAKQTAATYEAKAKAMMMKSGETSDSEEDSTTRTVTKELDKDTFLQLMVMQLQNQDPMSPMDNTDMIAQLAQFSALEQMNNLNGSFTEFGKGMQQLNFTSANGLLGRTISGLDVDGNLKQGTVDRVFMESGAVYLLVDDSVIPVGNVIEMKETASGSSK
jgi:flagellar basal-body rod modification protein FlgD